jgi:hypothetical protein
MAAFFHSSIPAVLLGAIPAVLLGERDICCCRDGNKERPNIQMRKGREGKERGREMRFVIQPNVSCAPPDPQRDRGSGLNRVKSGDERRKRRAEKRQDKIKTKTT